MTPVSASKRYILRASTDSVSCCPAVTSSSGPSLAMKTELASTMDGSVFGEMVGGDADGWRVDTEEDVRLGAEILDGSDRRRRTRGHRR